MDWIGLDWIDNEQNERTNLARSEAESILGDPKTRTSNVMDHVMAGEQQKEHKKSNPNLPVTEKDQRAQTDGLNSTSSAILGNDEADHREMQSLVLFQV